jgi:hypothetical protein
MAKVTKSFRLDDATLALVEALKSRITPDHEHDATDVIEIAVRRLAKELGVQATDAKPAAKNKGGK